MSGHHNYDPELKARKSWILRPFLWCCYCCTASACFPIRAFANERKSAAGVCCCSSGTSAFTIVSIQSVEQVRNQFIADPQQQQQIAMPPQQMDQQLMQQMMAAPQLVFQQPSANENLLQLFAHMIDNQQQHHLFGWICLGNSLVCSNKFFVSEGLMYPNSSQCLFSEAVRRWEEPARF